MNTIDEPEGYPGIAHDMETLRQQAALAQRMAEAASAFLGDHDRWEGSIVAIMGRPFNDNTWPNRDTLRALLAEWKEATK